MFCEHSSLDAIRDFLNELADHPPRLPYEPTLIPMLFQATQVDSDVSLDEIARLIESSQYLATRVLAIANSAYYVLEFKVTSLQRAISVLGLKEVRALVLLTGMAAFAKGPKLPQGFDIHRHWRHHLRTASLARALVSSLRENPGLAGEQAEGLSALSADEAYVAGLLHDLGKVFLAVMRPANWQAITELQEKSGSDFATAEMEYWGIDHGIIGARVLHSWKVPLLLTDAITWHHAPGLAPSGRHDAELLAAANILGGDGWAVGSPLPEAVMGYLPQNTDIAALTTALEEKVKNDDTDALAKMF